MLKNPKGGGNYPDNFTEDELQQIGLGYDRMVRFMEKDDPNLRHPYDWYKYGQYGPTLGVELLLASQFGVGSPMSV